MSPEHRKAISLSQKKRWRRIKKAAKRTPSKPVAFLVKSNEAEFAHALSKAILAGLRLFR
jgi:hypothetical protein